MDYPTSPDNRERALEHVNKAANYQKMGLAPSVEHELAEAVRLDPSIVNTQAYQSIKQQSAERLALDEARRWPLRIAAGMLVVDAGLFGLLWLLNLAVGEFSEFLLWGLVHIVVDTIIAIRLALLKEDAARTALYWAGIGAVVGSLASLVAADLGGLFLQLTFSGSLFILLLGKPSNLKTALAVIVFAAGYIGGTCMLFVWGMMQGF